MAVPRSYARHARPCRIRPSTREGEQRAWKPRPSAKATLVYDNHDLIYAYGPLDEFCEVLSSRGLREGDLSIPAPHQHCYNQEFDAAERDVLKYWEWRHSPLRSDDDP